MPARRFFVHSADRPVERAWPHLGAEAGNALEVPLHSSILDQTRSIREDRRQEGGVVFAHSLRAVPAVLAADVAQPRALVLVEPALYDVARGDPSIERHISIVSDARDLAAEGDLRGFWAMLRPVMFGGAFAEETWENEMPVARHWATTSVPWGHGIRSRMLDRHATLIVTGGWNDEYESIAGTLAYRGAEHIVLPGARHRPQDLPQFASIVADFEARLCR